MSGNDSKTEHDSKVECDDIVVERETWDFVESVEWGTWKPAGLVVEEALD